MTVLANVHWLSEEIRGKKERPTSLRYLGVSRFFEHDTSWPDGAWTIELLFDIPPAEQAGKSVTVARARFLFPDAPHDRLHVGARFMVYEGLTPVADVEVVSP